MNPSLIKEKLKGYKRFIEGTGLVYYVSRYISASMHWQCTLLHMSPYFQKHYYNWIRNFYYGALIFRIIFYKLHFTDRTSNKSFHHSINSNSHSFKFQLNTFNKNRKHFSRKIFEIWQTHCRQNQNI